MSPRRFLPVLALPVWVAACVSPPPSDRASLSDVRITTPAPATCEVTRNGAITYRLPSTPGTIPAGSLTERSVVACTWLNAAGAPVKGTSGVGSTAFVVPGPGEIAFPPG